MIVPSEISIGATDTLLPSAGEGGDLSVRRPGERTCPDTLAIAKQTLNYVLRGIPIFRKAGGTLKDSNEVRLLPRLQHRTGGRFKGGHPATGASGKQVGVISSVVVNWCE